MNQASHPAPALSFGERYRLLFNSKGEDAWSILFGYPIARFLVVFLLPFTWPSPSTITLIGFVLKLASAAAIIPGFHVPVWGIVILLQVAQILDAMDGTLARARPALSNLGAFLDKITDSVGLYAICVAVGYRAFASSGNIHFIILGGVTAFCTLQLGYMYWIVRSAVPVSKSPALTKEKYIQGWSEIGKNWIGGISKFRSFGEADLYLWISVFAVADRWDYCVYLLTSTQVIALLKRTLDHLKTLAAIDRGDGTSPKP